MYKHEHGEYGEVQTCQSFGQFDDLQFDAFFVRCLRSCVTGIALICECQLHRLACGLLNLTRESRDRLALAGKRHGPPIAP